MMPSKFVCPVCGGPIFLAHRENIFEEFSIQYDTGDLEEVTYHVLDQEASLTCFFKCDLRSFSYHYDLQQKEFRWNDPDINPTSYPLEPGLSV